MVFNSLGGLVFYVVDLYVQSNPSADIQNIIDTFQPFIFKSCDMSTMYPFIKETDEIIASGANLGRFSKAEIIVSGRKYRVSTQWGYKGNGKVEIDNLISFAKIDLGENIVYSGGSYNPQPPTSISHPTIAKLKEHDDELISFYIAETKSVLTKQQYEEISNIDVIIDESGEYYYEIVGRYDLKGIIEEIGSILEGGRNAVGDFRSLLEELLHILLQILEVEYPINEYPFENRSGIFDEPIHIPNYEYSYKTIESLNNSLHETIEKIRELSNRVPWPAETRKLIEDILNRFWPQIVGRRRVSTVLGSFSASRNQITLYKSAIENWLPSVDYLKKLLDVYSHELFHAFHYVHMKKPTQWEYDDKSRMVKESLARFIEYRYGVLNICETTISADLIRVWNDNDMHDFPYAGAKHVDKFSGLCELMFKESVCKGTRKAFHLIDSASNL